VQRLFYTLSRVFQEIFYKKSLLENKQVFDPSLLFFLAILKITPLLILKPRHLGSVSYDMPFPIGY